MSPSVSVSIFLASLADAAPMVISGRALIAGLDKSINHGVGPKNSAHR
jgi:hypothetical protein